MNKKDTSNYFKKLNYILKKQERALPFLLIDLDILDANIATLKTNFNPKATFRIVVKSLPSYDLVNYVMKKGGTNNLMVFHQPFLTDLSSKLDAQADVLLGKPMPIKTAEYFYNNLAQSKNSFNPYKQIQWLVDTENRILEYVELAKKINKKIRLNLELDVGLRRGGFQNLKQLKTSLVLIQKNSAHIDFSGFMGYDPHIVKIPSILRSKKKSLKNSNTFYQEAKDLLKKEFPELWKETLTFNGAGSPTINLHKKDSPLNDIAAGSCLVKPTTFDIASLKEYQAASFIATPVLKKLEGTTIPGLEEFKGFLNLLSSQNRQSYFIYGGFWKADYCYPIGIQQNDLFGPSTNQTMLNAPVKTELNVDDFVFLRPHQSEFVFLQFGKLLTYRYEGIKETWSLLKNY